MTTTIETVQLNEWMVWGVNKETTFETTYLTTEDLTKAEVIARLEKEYAKQGWEVMYVELH